MMRQFLRKTGWWALVLVALVTAAVLSYSLPKHEVLKIVGGEVRRIDQDGRFIDPGKVVPVTHDVFFINTAELHEPEVHVFRNEDTGFGFPWYLKFDAADVQGRAQLLAQSNRTALITYYGWRIPMFSKFPNAVDVEPWDSEQEPFPWFNIVLLSLLLILFIFLAWKLHRLTR
jgi:hypothetical protein